MSICISAFVKSCAMASGASAIRYCPAAGTSGSFAVAFFPSPAHRAPSGTMHAAAATNPSADPRTPDCPRLTKSHPSPRRPAVRRIAKVMSSPACFVNCAVPFSAPMNDRVNAVTSDDARHRHERHRDVRRPFEGRHQRRRDREEPRRDDRHDHVDAQRRAERLVRVLLRAGDDTAHPLRRARNDDVVHHVRHREDARERPVPGKTDRPREKRLLDQPREDEERLGREHGHAPATRGTGCVLRRLHRACTGESVGSFSCCFGQIRGLQAEERPSAAGTPISTVKTRISGTETCLFSAKTRLFTTETRLFTTETRLFSAKTCLFSTETCLFSTETCLFSTKTRLFSTKTHLLAPKTRPLRAKSIFLAAMTRFLRLGRCIL